MWRKRNERGENPEPANANGRDVIGQAFAFKVCARAVHQSEQTWPYGISEGVRGVWGGL